MKALWRAVALAAVAALALVVFTGCGGDDEESQQTAEQNLCTSLTDFAATVVGLQGLLPGASEDDLESAADDVTEAWDQVVDDAKDVKTASVETIQARYEDLRDAIANRPTDTPIREVLVGLQPELAAFAQAWRDLANGLNCA